MKLKKITIFIALVMMMTSSNLVNVYAEDMVSDEISTENVDVNETVETVLSDIENDDLSDKDESDVDETSNACGDTLTWSIDNGVLKITGSGDMYAYSMDKLPPWNAQVDSIHEVVIDSTVTSIDEYAFGCTDIVVTCVAGSAAEQFCISHGIQVIAHAKQECLDNDSTTLVNQKEATCMEEGYTGDEVCSTCQTLVKQGEVIPKSDHELEVRDAKEATYLEEGYTGDEVCSICQTLVKQGEVIPKLSAKNKWVHVDETWYHFNEKGDLDKNTWIKGTSNGKWYYVNELGVMVTSSMCKDSTDKTYIFDENGAMLKGWQLVDEKWYYFNSDMKTDWQKINNKWYYFDTEGIMQTGIITDSTKKTYYLGTNGNMETGWKKLDEKWYYFNSDMKLDWQKINNKWYYFNTDGVMQTGIITDSTNKTYFLNENGAMITGWKKLDGNWYYFGSDRKTGWQLINNLWYYMNEEGIMQTGTIEIDGKSYSLSNSGSLTPQRYINATNVMLKKAGNNLRNCYNWVVNNFTYQTLPIHVNPPEGYTREQWYAVYGIENYRGNCFVFASSFTAAAKELGYDARYVEGRVRLSGGGYSQHGWCEITIDGATYVCDPEAQYELKGYNFYMQPIGNTVLQYVR